MIEWEDVERVQSRDRDGLSLARVIVFCCLISMPWWLGVLGVALGWIR